MSLYQKPGYASSEFKIAQAYSIAGLALILCGFVAASFEWPGQLAGLICVGLAPLVAIVPTVAYMLSRGRVKAAAEAQRPPPSRVF